ncbi:cytochrome P450 [Agromyces sp. NPDC049794]|uniref:cytochrome P450 n=1 Tax=unclassified Agromyces TaxID=2639701 RepID=UPI0033FCB7C4
MAELRTPDIRTIPRSKAIDDSYAFVRDGYLYGDRRFRRLGSDVFTARLAGRPVTVMFGAEAVGIFYEGERFSRDRAMPASVRHLLQDEGSVQALEGSPHRHRKSMFMQMLEPASIDELVSRFDAEWSAAGRRYAGRTVSLYDVTVDALTRTVVGWCGIPLHAVDLPELGGALAAMVDRAGSFGPVNWLARARRRRVEQWAAELILDVRRGRLEVASGSPVEQLALATDVDGTLLPEDIAAVELLNVLRPTVAVSRYLVFTAHAMHHHPDWRSRVTTDHEMAGHFANEVRRRYPFFPLIAGTVQRPFEWRGRDFEPGEWVILDLYATNHDKRLWSERNQFRPERFERWSGDPNTLVSQGGGDAATGHRCPGEAATIALTTRFAELIAPEPPFTVPAQDLRISLRRIPALPQDRFLVAFAERP